MVMAAAGVVLVSSCGSGDSAECLTSDVGEVCADNANGSIEFSGSGLQPDSAVLIQHPELGLSVYEVDDDGTFEPNGGGVVSLVVEAPFTFTITATGADGQLIEGDIDISS
jgi:hypothetical protein